MNCGVYTITSPSGKCYVGSAWHLAGRKKQHFTALKHGKHGNRILQAAWNKYGNQLIFKPIIICSKENALMYEQIAMEALKPAYNLRKIAESNAGLKHSTESIELMRKVQKERFTIHGEVVSEKTRKAVAESNRVREVSSETRYKHGKSRRGKKETPEETAYRTRNLVGRVIGPQSEEFKARRIEAANAGREKAKQNDPIAWAMHCAAIAGRKREYWAEQRRLGTSKRPPHSEETKQKMRDTWAEKRRLKELQQ